jgi:hypothetical protein
MYLGSRDEKSPVKMAVPVELYLLKLWIASYHQLVQLPLCLPVQVVYKIGVTSTVPVG